MGLISEVCKFLAMHRGYGGEPETRPMNVNSQWKHFVDWQKSLGENASPVADTRPWMTFDAIDAISEFLDQSKRIFEWGSGGSTLFFRTRATHVISIEHSASYWSELNSLLSKEGHEYLLIEPDAIGEDDSEFESIVYPGKSFKSYCNSINNYPDKAFDLVCVDGRCRNACLANSLDKVAEEGMLVLDNSERLRYQFPDELLTNAWRVEKYAGCGPYNRYFWETTIFRRANAR